MWILKSWNICSLYPTTSRGWLSVSLVQSWLLSHVLQHHSPGETTIKYLKTRRKKGLISQVKNVFLHTVIIATQDKRQSPGREQQRQSASANDLSLVVSMQFKKHMLSTDAQNRLITERFRVTLIHNASLLSQFHHRWVYITKMYVSKALLRYSTVNYFTFTLSTSSTERCSTEQEQCGYQLID